MSELISREAATAICDETACETDSVSARRELFHARDRIRAIPAVQPDAGLSAGGGAVSLAEIKEAEYIWLVVGDDILEVYYCREDAYHAQGYFNRQNIPTTITRFVEAPE